MTVIGVVTGGLGRSVAGHCGKRGGKAGKKIDYHFCSDTMTDLGINRLLPFCVPFHLTSSSIYTDEDFF